MLIKRILIVGLGSIGRRHVRIARGLYPSADIRILRHQFTEEVLEFSNGSFFDIKEALTFRPEVAIISTPASFHLEIAGALIETGVHTLIEKPLSVSTAGVAQLIESARSRGVALAVGYNLRYLPSLNFFRDYIKNGGIGKVLSVRCEVGKYLPTWRPQSDYRKTVSARQELGGGVLLELSHELDYLRWIFGEVEWANAIISHQSNLEINVEDLAHITLGFAANEQGFQLIASVSLDFIRHDTTRECYAIGEHGTLRWSGITGCIDLCGPEEAVWHELFRSRQEVDGTYISEWKNFISSISGKDLPLVGGVDGLRVLELIEAIRLSSDKGKKIFL